MTSLVNEMIKFQKLISQICQYFLLKKCKKLLQAFAVQKLLSFFSNKNTSVLGYEVLKHLKGFCTVFQHALKSLEITGIVLS